MIKKKIAQQPKAVVNLKILDIKSVFIEHQKTSRKLHKIMKQTKKVSSGKNPTNRLYSETKKMKIF